MVSVLQLLARLWTLHPLRWDLIVETHLARAQAPRSSSLLVFVLAVNENAAVQQDLRVLTDIH